MRYITFVVGTVIGVVSVLGAQAVLETKRYVQGMWNE